MTLDFLVVSPAGVEEANHDDRRPHPGGQQVFDVHPSPLLAPHLVADRRAAEREELVKRVAVAGMGLADQQTLLELVDLVEAALAGGEFGVGGAPAWGMQVGVQAIARLKCRESAVGGPEDPM